MVMIVPARKAKEATGLKTAYTVCTSLDASTGSWTILRLQVEIVQAGDDRLMRVTTATMWNTV